MGTNYYVESDPPCPTCGHEKERLHIGKSSLGWQFLFAPYPDLGLTSWKAWRAYLEKRPGLIRDEYGRAMPLDEFAALVASKQDDLGAEERHDSDGFRFARDWDFS